MSLFYLDGPLLEESMVYLMWFVYIFQRLARRAIDGACTTSCHSQGIDGQLKIKVKYARDLKDKDAVGKSDPYVRITAVRDSTLVRVTKKTSIKKGKLDVTWNQVLSFGCGKWKHIDVSVWDSDKIGADDLLMPIKTFPICNYGKCSITYTRGKSKLNFDLILTEDRNHCQPNPCNTYNSISCIDGCGSARCVCKAGFYGSYCQYYHPDFEDDFEKPLP